jgi:hypothetical protein
MERLHAKVDRIVGQREKDQLEIQRIGNIATLYEV